jgi:hypothetical protein
MKTASFGSNYKPEFFFTFFNSQHTMQGAKIAKARHQFL